MQHNDVTPDENGSRDGKNGECNVESDGERRSFRAGSRKTVHAQSTHGRGKPVKGWLGESVLW